MWNEASLSALTNQLLHPYMEWCPGLTLDLYTMDCKCGIGHIPYGAEIVYREHPHNATLGANAKPLRQLPDNIKTVQRLHELGALNNQNKATILALKAIVDEQIQIATAERERIPFAVAQRVIQAYLNRWSSISKSLEYVGKPYNPYGSTVNNLPPTTEEGDDKKRKASRSLSHVTTTGEEDDGELGEETSHQQEAEDNSKDRQSPRGSGGNQV